MNEKEYPALYGQVRKKNGEYQVKNEAKKEEEEGLRGNGSDNEEER